MKKNFKGFGLFILALVASIIFVPSKVLAADVATIGDVTYEDLATAVKAVSTGDTIQLISDIDFGTTEINYGVAITKAVTIDLNGHTISANAKYGVFYIYGGTLTINDTSSDNTGKVNNTSTKNYDGIDIAAGGTLIVNGGAIYGRYAGVYCYSGTSGKGNSLILIGGAIEGYYYGVGVFDYGSVTVNGGSITANGYALLNNGASENETTMTINGGVIKDLSGKQVAIYHPGPGTLTVNGGIVEGGTGIEMRSGTLIIPEDSTAIIRGVALPASSTENNNGATSRGVGIAIAQHSTENDINISIAGGEISGYSAVYESNPNGNSEEGLAKIEVSITGGTFNTTNGGTQVIYSEDLTSFITGGEYNSAVADDYINEDYAGKKIGDVYLVDKPVVATVTKTDTSETVEEVTLGVSNQEAVEAYLYSYLENTNDSELIKILEENFV